MAHMVAKAVLIHGNTHGGGNIWSNKLNEAKSLVTEVSNAVGPRKRRRVEEDAGSSPAVGVGRREPVSVVDRQVLTDGGGERWRRRGALKLRSECSEALRAGDKGNFGEKTGGGGGGGGVRLCFFIHPAEKRKRLRATSQERIEHQKFQLIDIGRSSQVGTSTLRSQVGTSTPHVSTSFSRRDALGEIKDEVEDKFDEDTWFSTDEKRNKMTKDSIVELLEEIPLPPPFSARVPALQEPANYGTDLETSVYEGQIRSGYRVPMHPFAVAFFNHYKMAPCQLVPNG
ncbi:hypothetical protein RJ639_021806 [Escallonia herrerae]|uniref:Uncharacterized protein n=1 Tax=Escallonia herrerae TaxID=1293975 RepID=A0AA88V4X6_9ASTE|nr:hypothetical protein RJ639_021806 [Escallonia herrerae]